MKKKWLLTAQQIGEIIIKHENTSFPTRNAVREASTKAVEQAEPLIRADERREVAEWLIYYHQRITKEKGLLLYINSQDWESFVRGELPERKGGNMNKE